MLNNREISEQYEVQVNTLYNWQKTKPKLYKYLQHADYNKERNREINVLLNEYAKDIKKDFTLDEITYIINSPTQLVSIDEVKNFHKVFIEKEYKQIPSKSDMILGIYDKILSMNIIEKYILYKKIHKYREDDKINSSDIKSFFSEFIC